MEYDATSCAALAVAQGAGDAEAESVAIWPLTKRGFNRRRPTLLAAFLERVAFGMTPCWHWVGSRSEIGYGMFAGARTTYGCPEIVAHRISWHLHCGPIPDGQNVLHRCDVRACVNPDHLFLGTQLDNIADMVAKGRHRNVPMFGEDNPGAVLTVERVLAMRAAHAAGVSQHALAKQFGVSVMTVNRCVRRLSWGTV